MSADDEVYGLIVRGDNPRFNFLDGDVLIIDPKVPPEPGNLVVCYPENEKPFVWEWGEADADGPPKFCIHKVIARNRRLP